MRTREEQVSALACALFNKHTDIDECIAIANKYTQEAEERAQAECAADTRRLEWLDSGCCDVRFRSEPIADTGDADTYCDIIEHHMAEPKERIVGSAYTIRAAIDAAMEGGK